MYVIAGLGNPGEEYERTRHNAGRMALEHFRSTLGFSEWKKEKHLKAFAARGSVGEHDVLLIEPDAYINRSGVSLAPLVKEGVMPDRVIVLHDEIDLPLGTFRIAFNKGAGGHNGVRSVTETLGTKAFTRIRIGVAPVTFFGNMRKPVGEARVVRFVLAPFSSRERAKLDAVCPDIAGAIETILREGREKAMLLYHSPADPKKKN